VADDHPAPDEELTTGPPVEPRQAATVILLRGGADALEVLLVKRNPASRFMGGAWVFPGGALDEADGTDEPGQKTAAARELHEEAGVTLPDSHALVKFSRWITPAQVTIRFDTHFYLGHIPDGAAPAVDGEECVDYGWFTPSAALDAHRAGEILLVFPTIKHLEQFAHFRSAEELISYARGRDVVPVEPKVLMSGETARIVLPGEPGYDDSGRPGGDSAAAGGE
jgi:8-oxo-dGTP pyrophosphatase MutT (NUDIX family)